ncbi:unnamed protein product [Polarella glacialis]|uniref:Uncharacterized protein n=1 Tax=Polarella glacialis TaxID=89957 RepID=A0A813L7L5_POLGL|nr:unnamed protein product [Polarella glacialis]
MSEATDQGTRGEPEGEGTRPLETTEGPREELVVEEARTEPTADNAAQASLEPTAGVENSDHDEFPDSEKQQQDLDEGVRPELIPLEASAAESWASPDPSDPLGLWGSSGDTTIITTTPPTTTTSSGDAAQLDEGKSSPPEVGEAEVGQPAETESVKRTDLENENAKQTDLDNESAKQTELEEQSSGEQGPEQVGETSNDPTLEVEVTPLTRDHLLAFRLPRSSAGADDSNSSGTAPCTLDDNNNNNSNNNDRQEGAEAQPGVPGVKPVEEMKGTGMKALRLSDGGVVPVPTTSTSWSADSQPVPARHSRSQGPPRRAHDGRWALGGMPVPSEQQQHQQQHQHQQQQQQGRPSGAAAPAAVGPGEERWGARARPRWPVESSTLWVGPLPLPQDREADRQLLLALLEGTGVLELEVQRQCAYVTVPAEQAWEVRVRVTNRMIRGGPKLSARERISAASWAPIQVSPLEVIFSQAEISDRFREPREGLREGGRHLEESLLQVQVQRLPEGWCLLSAPFAPIRVVADGHRFLALDNRRLYVLQRKAVELWPTPCLVDVLLCDGQVPSEHWARLATRGAGDRVTIVSGESADPWGGASRGVARCGRTWSCEDALAEREFCRTTSRPHQQQQQGNGRSWGDGGLLGRRSPQGSGDAKARGGSSGSGFQQQQQQQQQQQHQQHQPAKWAAAVGAAGCDVGVAAPKLSVAPPLLQQQPQQQQQPQPQPQPAESSSSGPIVVEPGEPSSTGSTHQKELGPSSTRQWDKNNNNSNSNTLADSVAPQGLERPATESDTGVGSSGAGLGGDSVRDEETVEAKKTAKDSVQPSHSSHGEQSHEAAVDLRGPGDEKGSGARSMPSSWADEAGPSWSKKGSYSEELTPTHPGPSTWPSSTTSHPQQAWGWHAWAASGEPGASSWEQGEWSRGDGREWKWPDPSAWEGQGPSVVKGSWLGPAGLEQRVEAEVQEALGLADQRQPVSVPQQQQQRQTERKPPRRVDPDTGVSHTFEEFEASFTGRFTSAEIQDYWRDACVEPPLSL